jgi:hypothetical protein
LRRVPGRTGVAAGVGVGLRLPGVVTMTSSEMSSVSAVGGDGTFGVIKFPTAGGGHCLQEEPYLLS